MRYNIRILLSVYLVCFFVLLIFNNDNIINGTFGY